MAWVCPNCGRSFKNRNQFHSCVKINVKDLFKNPAIYSLFEKLEEEVQEFGDVKVHASKSAVNFSVENTFMAVKPKADLLEIEFLMDKDIDSPLIHRSIQLGKTKWAVTVRIESSKQINKELLSLVKHAYGLSK